MEQAALNRIGNINLNSTVHTQGVPPKMHCFIPALLLQLEEMFRIKVTPNQLLQFEKLVSNMANLRIFSKSQYFIF